MHPVFNYLDMKNPRLSSIRQTAEKNEQLALNQLKEYFQAKEYQGFLGPFGEESLAAVKKEGMQLSEKEKKVLLERAQAFSNQQFLFQEPWDMERSQKPEFFPEEIQWTHIPDQDPEWMYMLNRHGFFQLYAQAYLLFEEDTYFFSFLQQLTDWLSKNPLRSENHWTTWRTIDAGIRLRNWMKSLEIFLQHPSFPAELFAELIISIATHLTYIQEALQENRLQTNWIILEMNGSYLAAAFFSELKVSTTILEKIERLLPAAAENQVTKEGLHWEQSYQYHNEVLLKLSEMELIAKRNQRPFPQKVTKVIKKMAQATSNFCKPDGTQAAYGDSDVEELRDLLLYLEQYFPERLINVSKEPNRFGLFSSGPSYLKRPEKGKCLQSFAFKESGVYLLKEPKEAVHVQFKCGFLGHGHGHDDLLHVDLYAHEDILVDSGRYSYAENHQRLAFKQAMAHNTLIVDHCSFQAHSNPWSAKKVAQPVNAHHFFSKTFDFVEGGHLGYFQLSDPVFVNRKLCYLKPDILVVSDEVKTSGYHEYQQLFHLAQPNRVTIGKNSSICYNGDQRRVRFQTFCSENAQQGNWEVSSVTLSRDYNQKQLSECAGFMAAGEGNLVITTIIHWGEETEIKELPVYHEYGWLRNKETIQAFVFPSSGKKLLLAHFEDQDSRRAYLVEGKSYYGRVLAVDGGKVIKAY